MRILFIHQNFPAQFKHLALHLNKDPKYEVMAICQTYAPKLAGIHTIQYSPNRTPSKNTHHYNRPLEAHTLNGQAVANELLKLKKSGFEPDIVIAHTAWGEALYVKDVFPKTKLIGFFEFYYHSHLSDTDFDPEFPSVFDDVLRIRNKNATHLLSLEASDIGVCPTQFQKDTFPKEYQHKLILIHEGINTALAKPDKNSFYRFSNDKTLTKDDEVVTYISRNLEPYRGFHQFMYALEIMCKCRPKTHFIVVGGDDISYGRKLPKGENWRHLMLNKIKIDENRVQFLNNVPYQEYLKILQISSVHIYLTVPFVLSWSMLEAMSVECALVASNTQPVNEVIKHEQNGILVDFFSPKDIAHNVDRILDNPKNYTKMRELARKTILENYTIQQGINKYIALINL